MVTNKTDAVRFQDFSDLHITISMCNDTLKSLLAIMPSEKLG